MSATPTIAAPGDVGASIGALQTVTLTLTNAQINALSSTSTQVLIPAPGAGLVIIPVTVSVSLNYVATFTGGGKKLIIQLGPSNSVFLWNTAILDTPQTSSRLATGSIGFLGNYGNVSQYANRSLRIAAGTSYKGGAGSTVTFTCLYYILTL